MRFFDYFRNPKEEKKSEEELQEDKTPLFEISFSPIRIEDLVKPINWEEEINKWNEENKIQREEFARHGGCTVSVSIFKPEPKPEDCYSHHQPGEKGFFTSF